MDCLLEKEEFHKVIGQIYKITNSIDNKIYVGQTRSHRLNRNKYRPFGYIGRFKDHISEATHTSKRTICSYLNNALLKYGIENFSCELITTCSIDELDFYEVKYISELNSKFPNGYNLTNGGQKMGFNKGPKNVLQLEDEYTIKPHQVRQPNLKRSDYTKKLISERVIAFQSDKNFREKMMKNVQNQHLKQKFDKYKNVSIDENNINSYICIRKNKVCVIIEKIKTNFVGKYETIDETTKRAKLFILELINQQRNQIAGTPLEPLLPLSFGNICQELG